jgi:choline kinase
MYRKIIIPMSGIGKRFLDAGYNNPKHLIEVDGYPIIKHVVDLFPGEDSFIFVCNEEHLEKNNLRDVLLNIKPNCEIFGIPYEKKGPVYSISKIFEKIDDEEEIIISYCDYGTVWNYSNFIKDIKKRDLHGSIACYTGFHPHMLGSDNYAFVREKNLLAEEVREKMPFTNDKMMEFASNGTYFFKSGKILKKYLNLLLESDENINGEYYVSLAYNKMIKDGLRVGVFEIEKMLQWGTPYDLENYVSWGNYFKTYDSQKDRPKNPKGTTTILPMSGAGSRFVSSGYEVPKPFINIDGVPMFIKSLENMPTSDNHIFISLEEHFEKYRMEKIVSNFYKNYKIIQIKDTTQGQACTCEIGINGAKIDLDLPIFIKACDNGELYDYDEYQKLIEDQSVDIIVFAFKNNQSSKNHPEMYAWLDIDDNMFLNRVYNKKFIFDDPLKHYAITGTMFFRKARYLIEGLKFNIENNIRTNGEFYVDDILNVNIESGLNVTCFPVNDYICWGTPNDLKTYEYWSNHFRGNLN